MRRTSFERRSPVKRIAAACAVATLAVVLLFPREGSEIALEPAVTRAALTLDHVEPRRVQPIGPRVVPLPAAPISNIEQRHEMRARSQGGLEAAADDSAAENAPPPPEERPERMAPAPAPPTAAASRPKVEGAADDEGSDATP
jgi:hypothetical protein